MRKVSFSLAFFEGMSFSKMTDSSGWKSSKVFINHYLKEIGDVKHCCMAAGAVVTGLRPDLPASRCGPRTLSTTPTVTTGELEDSD